MNNKNELRKLKQKITPILKSSNVVRAGIFGSYARGEAKKRSDIDILIEVRKGKKFSLLDLVGLQMELEDKLGKKVDLLTYNGISPYLKKYILEDEIKII